MSIMKSLSRSPSSQRVGTRAQSGSAGVMPLPVTTSNELLLDREIFKAHP
jgi:hypothetical protein